MEFFSYQPQYMKRERLCVYYFFPPIRDFFSFFYCFITSLLFYIIIIINFTLLFIITVLFIYSYSYLHHWVIPYNEEIWSIQLITETTEVIVMLPNDDPIQTIGSLPYLVFSLKSYCHVIMR